MKEDWPSKYYDTTITLIHPLCVIKTVLYQQCVNFLQKHMKVQVQNKLIIKQSCILFFTIYALKKPAKVSFKIHLFLLIQGGHSFKIIIFQEILGVLGKFGGKYLGEK